MKQTPCKFCGHIPTKAELLERLLRRPSPPTVKEATTELGITHQYAYREAGRLGLRFTLERNRNA